MRSALTASLILIFVGCLAQNRNPLATDIITTDLDYFWEALEKAGPEVNPTALHELYINRGSKGVQGFMDGRIINAEHLAKEIKKRIKYYKSVKINTDSIAGMKAEIRQSLVKMKEIYPDAIFPPVYFVIGAMNSGGTSSKDGLIIGSEMYGLTPQTPMEELNDWHKTVIKPVNQIPYVVAHELIHFMQTYNGRTLLAASIKEGSADFLAELISGKHINQHVHDFANPREKELWLEFKERMNKKDYQGWLYSSSPGRPNDLGYWMGYKITRAYYEQATDKRAAIKEILTIKNFEKFLEKSGYVKKFE